MATLSYRQRAVLTTLAFQPAADYQRVSEVLGIPPGSIGPTRARALARLSRNPQLQALRDDPVTRNPSTDVSSPPPRPPIRMRR
jgi:hypothetical protein